MKVKHHTKAVKLHASLCLQNDGGGKISYILIDLKHIEVSR